MGAESGDGGGARRHPRTPDLWGAGVAAGLATLVGVISLRLWEWRPGTPLSLAGDSPLVLTQLDDILRNGWFWSDDAIGFPLGQNASFFPELDVIHILAVKLLGLPGGSTATVGSLYFLLGWPLVAVTTYLLARSERIGRTPSVVVGVLFAAAPYHAQRFEHFWLAAYWTVPVALWVVLLAARGRTPLDPDGRRSRARVALWVLALVIIGLSGAYYAGFTLILLAAVVVLRAGAGRPAGWWRGGLASMAGVGLVAAVPLVAARIGMSGTALTGTRPATRNPLESERYAGRLIDLMLPWEEHRLAPLANLTTLYRAAGRPVFETMALGVVGVCGVTALLLVGLRALSTSRPVAERLRLWCALLVVSGLFYTTGGLGSVVALFATPQLRTWSRLSLFLLLLGLLAVAHWLDRLSGRWAATAVPAAVLVLGVLDQTNAGAASDYGRIRDRLDSTASYTRALADATGGSCGVLQLPVMRFPEGYIPPGYDLNSQLVQHLTTTRLAWSHGGMSGTQAGDWLLGLELDDPARLLGALRAAGFCAIEVDTTGLALDRPAVDALTATLGEPVARTADGRLVAWSLSGVDSGGAAEASRLLGPVLVGMTSGEIRVDGEQVSQDSGPVTGFSTENIVGRPVGPITVSVDVTSLGAPEREVVVRDPDGRVLARTTATEDGPTRLTFETTAPVGYQVLPVSISGDPVRDARDRSVSARFSNLTATSSGPARIASLQDQARSSVVLP